MNTVREPRSEADRQALADLLYPDAEDVAEVRARYGPRPLPEGAWVTRFAPSPTGFIHIGGVLAALLNWKLARQSDGVFILRVEDTDQKREVEQGTRLIVQALAEVGLEPDEGPGVEGAAHGPYMQSERRPIYRAFAKRMVAHGFAYPCFLTPDELSEIREAQMREKGMIGVHGAWARYRDEPVEGVATRLDAGDDWVLRLLADAFDAETVTLEDRIRGELALPANQLDTVLLKSDGLPTYHFAHPIDDTLMGVSVVIRGDEWISTAPVHAQVFEGAGLPLPPFAHIAPVAKIDDGSRRKLSKRKDPEASMTYYAEAGYLRDAIVEYLMNLLDSGFEEWRSEHPTSGLSDFTLSLDRLGRSSALFDLDKLDDVSRDVVARLPAADLVSQVLTWAEEHDPDLARVLAADPPLTAAALNIGRDDEPPRKDIGRWLDVRERFGFFFDELFAEIVPAGYAQLPELDPEDAAAALEFFRDGLDTMLELDEATWFGGVKEHAVAAGYATNAKKLKKEPEAYRGTVGDFMMTLRVALTGSRRSPSLHSVARILGMERVVSRLDRVIEHLEG